MAVNGFSKFQDKMMFYGLNVVEKFQRGAETLQFSPTFIVAPPRAGTTLTRQVVSWAIPTSYFSNLTAISSFHLGKPLPIITAKMAKKMGGDQQLSSFESNFGRTEGRGAPAEGETIWAYWFRDRYGPVEPENVSPQQAEGMYRAVAATEQVFGLPFFNKTTVLSLRIRAIRKVFPNALFIQVMRDPLDTAQSIYKARTTRYPTWLGARPHECRDISGKSVLQQVCEQVYYVEKNIARERAIVGEQAFLTVHYKDICQKPQQEAERIAAFMDANGAPARLTRPLPEAFELSHGRKVDEAEYHEMRRLLDKLYRQ
ncbi:MAG: sulfotransferase [Ardenticatenaceae bacterium]|nr:sulfotransferase [Anaerolineales bacterium]MCB8941860.1 sulfotransferase [Ardenticatenaceae bacterium]MCB8972974.1 sulfotransferase [Ardenticatenaceae bacterium]